VHVLPETLANDVVSWQRIFVDRPANRNLEDRVFQAAEAVLERDGSVGPLELFMEMRLLQPVHFQDWRRGKEHYRVLQKWIQVGPEKFTKTLELFQEWVEQRKLRPIEAEYVRPGPEGPEQLWVTEDGDPQWEKFYRTHYASGDLPQKKTARLAEKLKKAPELVVFDKVSREGNCTKCNAELSKGNFLFLEKGQPLCLKCAGLDHLLYLPAGNMALTRRARKYSTLSAVVVRFSRARKRYERKGLLVEREALRKAQEECATSAEPSLKAEGS
jgi:hypothetical protein